MPKPKPPYPAEYRQQIVELARAGRTPAELAREFGPTAPSIANWIAHGTPTLVGFVASVAGQTPIPGLKRALKAHFTWGRSAQTPAPRRSRGGS